jgi:hypothetical protein
MHSFRARVETNIWILCSNLSNFYHTEHVFLLALPKTILAFGGGQSAAAQEVGTQGITHFAKLNFPHITLELVNYLCPSN